jgi:uncharacterized repeat protein (TIGR02543 family)
MKKSRNFFKRGVASLVSTCVAFSITVVAFSAPGGLVFPPQPNQPAASFAPLNEPLVLPEYYITTASIIETDENGALRLGVSVRNSDGSAITDPAVSFTYLWQFRTAESGVWSPAPGANTGAEYSSATATSAGFYRCVVTYGEWGTPPPDYQFITNEVEVSKELNTKTYFAVICENGINANQNINLRTIIYDRYGNVITDADSKFTFQWEFAERLVMYDIIYNNNGVPIGSVPREPTYTFHDITGATSQTYSQSNANVSGRFRCRVTYIGDGEPVNNIVVLLTGYAEWTVTLTNVSITNISQNSLQRGTPLPGNNDSNGRFDGIRINFINNALSVSIQSGNSSNGSWVWYTLRLYALINGERILLGETSGDADGRGSTNPVSIGFGLDIQTTYYLVYDVRRIRDNDPNSNHNYHVIGEIPINVGGTTTTTTITEIVTTSSEESDIKIESDDNIQGYGIPIIVHYPTYPADTLPGNGDLTVEYPAHKINFDANGGEGSMTEEIRKRYSDYSIKSNEFTKQDHGFAGWNASPSDHEPVDFLPGATIFDIQENITLYAQWVQGVATVTFNPNGGTVTPESESVVIGGTLPSLPTPEREGYTFNGWFFQPSGGGTQVTALVTVFNENTTIFAQWTLITYTVTWHTNGGEPAPVQTIVNHNGVIGVPSEMTRPGYTLGGWFNDAGFTSAASFPVTGVTSDRDFHAQWMGVSFTNQNGEPMIYILLPANSDEGTVLSGRSLRVYFKLAENTTILDVTFSYASVTVGWEAFEEHDPENDIWYFYLDPAVVEAAFNDPAYNIDGDIKLHRLITGKEVENALNIRRIGLFNLH